jgi:hypothetical protein
MESRLTKDNNYIRPDKTFQENLSKEEIKEKLQDYTQVDDISKVPVNTHLRYFSLVTDKETGKTKKMFRMGGLLKNKDNYDQYVVLSNGTKSWSVNTKTSIFFKKMKNEEIHMKYQKKLNEMEKMIKKLKESQS